MMNSASSIKGQLGLNSDRRCFSLHCELSDGNYYVKLTSSLINKKKAWMSFVLIGVEPNENNNSIHLLLTVQLARMEESRMLILRFFLQSTGLGS